MIAIIDLPHVNATLNGLALVCLTIGFMRIKAGNRTGHMRSMIAALAVSAAFLVTYLIYHFNAGLAKFGGEGVIRPIYFSILITHVIAAIMITVMVPLTVWRAASKQFDRHRRLARWTWPLWMFVAVSGIIVYVMAIHLYPDPAGPYA